MSSLLSFIDIFFNIVDLVLVAKKVLLMVPGRVRLSLDLQARVLLAVARARYNEFGLL